MRRAIRHERPLYWALLLSLALHCAALSLFPAIDAGARSLRVRIVSGGGAARLDRGASGPTATPRLLSQTDHTPVAQAAKAAHRELSSGGPPTRAKRSPEAPDRQPDSAPHTAEQAGLDAGALRGLRVALASGLAGISLPSGVVGASAEAKLVFGEGGRLLAVSFSSGGKSRDLEARLRDALMKAAGRVALPPDLRGARFELELAFEVGDDGR